MELSKKPSKLEQEIINSLRKILIENNLFIEISVEEIANDKGLVNFCFIKNREESINIDLLKLLATNNLGN